MNDKLWDLIVVGAGSAGLPAGIRAAQRGINVLQIEADERIGGTLHWSSGQMAAAGTQWQKDLNIDDDPDGHYEDAQRIAKNTIDPILGRLAINHGADTMDWLGSIGFQLDPAAPQAGVVHEPYTVRRYYWGTNAALSVLDVLKPLHERLVQENRLTLKLDTRMESLIVENGVVAGVRATGADGVQQVFYAKQVALTSGGYAASPELWHELTPDLPLCSWCNPYSRGDGVLAARDIGAKVDGEDKFLCTVAGWREDPEDPLSGQFFNMAPNQRKPWEIYVDTQGKRFMREDHPSIDYHENHLLNQPNMQMFVIADEAIVQNAPAIHLMDEKDFRQKLGNHPAFLKADALESLAEQMQVPGENLIRTVETFNAAVEQQSDPDFGREFLLRKIETPPFYALVARGSTVVSPAGLNANEKLQVLNTNGEVIPNLYAAGEVLGFTRLSGNAFVGGMSLTPALTFGRLLGEWLG
ncbi:MAG: FAD-binding protein [Pseudomonadota bacterium]